jgi:hypothetical protein
MNLVKGLECKLKVYNHVYLESSKYQKHTGCVLLKGLSLVAGELPELTEVQHGALLKKLITL